MTTNACCAARRAATARQTRCACWRWTRVQRANSGAPGAPMGMAEMAVALWSGHLRHDPADPQWLDRDRFVLSNGHASMLLYALLHLTGYELPLSELQRFRQLHSLTPGHPRSASRPASRRHRPARPGHPPTRRVRARRADAGARVQPPGARSSTTAPTSSSATAA